MSLPTTGPSDPSTVRIMVTRADLAPLVADPFTGLRPPASSIMSEALLVLLPAVRQPVYERRDGVPVLRGDCKGGPIGVRLLLASFGRTCDRRGLFLDRDAVASIQGGRAAFDVAKTISDIRAAVPARDVRDDRRLAATPAVRHR